MAKEAVQILTPDEQMRVFHLRQKGLNPHAISLRTGWNRHAIKAVLEHETVVPRRTREYKCDSCHNKVFYTPCMICLVRDHENGY